jgi:hypothetical protein
MSKIDRKDKKLLKEIKRIKNLQKGLYKEYEIPGFEEDLESKEGDLEEED